MKKSIILTILCLFSIFIYANVVTDLAKTAKNTAITVVDSTKSAVVNTVKTVDTSSNFKAIYGDLKDGLVALGSSLKVGAEHVYIVIVKQQVVNSVTWTIVYLLTGLYFFLWIRGFIKYGDKMDDAIIPYSIFGGFVAIGLIIIFGVTLNTTIMGFVNPEYGAMKDVINFVQSVSNGTCNTCH